MKSKTENPLFKREVVKIELEHPAATTPNRKTVLAVAVKELNTKPELVMLNKIQTVYGTAKSIITVHAYKNRKDLEANEPKYLIKRNSFKEEEKKEEKPAPAAPAEVPKEEEKKEESKPAEKPKEEAKPIEEPKKEEKK